MPPVIGALSGSDAAPWVTGREGENDTCGWSLESPQCGGYCRFLSYLFFFCELYAWVVYLHHFHSTVSHVTHIWIYEYNLLSLFGTTHMSTCWGWPPNKWFFNSKGKYKVCGHVPADDRSTNCVLANEAPEPTTRWPGGFKWEAWFITAACLTYLGVLVCWFDLA